MVCNYTVTSSNKQLVHCTHYFRYYRFEYHWQTVLTTLRTCTLLLQGDFTRHSHTVIVELTVWHVCGLLLSIPHWIPAKTSVTGAVREIYKSRSDCVCALSLSLSNTKAFRSIETQTVPRQQSRQQHTIVSGSVMLRQCGVSSLWVFGLLDGGVRSSSLEVTLR